MRIIIDAGLLDVASMAAALTNVSMNPCTFTLFSRFKLLDSLFRLHLIGQNLMER